MSDYPRLIRRRRRERERERERERAVLFALHLVADVLLQYHNANRHERADLHLGVLLCREHGLLKVDPVADDDAVAAGKFWINRDTRAVLTDAAGEGCAPKALVAGGLIR